MGVSPWYWWADVPVMKQANVYIKPGQYSDGEPAVTYRGIFLNDEAPCLTRWVKHTYGTNYGDHRFYARVCELILRLKGNFLWPAMWSWAFYADDPQNSKQQVNGSHYRHVPPRTDGTQPSGMVTQAQRIWCMGLYN